MKNTLTILFVSLLLLVSSFGQTLKTLNYNTANGQIIYSGSNTLTFTNAIGFGAAAETRTNLGLGSAATSDSSAFQPASLSLTNLSANDGSSLTNIPISGVASLQTSLDAKLATNGSALGLTNFPILNQNTTGTASNVTGVVALANGGTGSTNASDARLALQLGSAATNDSTAFQSSSLSLSNLSLNDGSGLTNIAISGVANLQSSLDSKLATNGSAAGLTNFPTLNQNTTGTASNVTGVVALANGGTGATNASGARSSLELGTAATSDASAFQPASLALSNLSLNDGSNLTNIAIAGVVGLQGSLDTKLATNGSAANLTNFPILNQNTTGTASNVTGVVALINGGTGATNASGARSALELGTAATSDASAFQPASLSLTNLSANNGSALTNIAIAGVVNLQASLDSKLATNGSAQNLTNFPTLNQNTTGTASNVTGVVAVVNGGTGATNAESARVNLGGTTVGSAVFTASNGVAAQLALFGTNVDIASSSGITGISLSDGQTKLLSAISFPYLGGSTQASITRTNLGLGATWLTNTDASSFRTAIGLGSAATNDASAFQPSSLSLSNLSANNGAGLTNIPISGVVNLQSSLDSKLATNGNAIALTNFPSILLRTNGDGSGLTGLTAANINGTVALASNVTGVVALVNGGTGATNAAGARTALELGTAATNPASAFQPASPALTNLAANNGGNLTNITAANVVGTVGLASNITGTAPLASNVTGVVALVNGGTGATNASGARAALELGTAATNNASAFQPSSLILSNLSLGNGSALTNIAISGVVNLQAALDSKLATNGSAAGLTNFPTLNQNTTGTASNVTGVVAIANGGTASTTAGGARTNLGLGATNNVTFASVSTIQLEDSGQVKIDVDDMYLVNTNADGNAAFDWGGPTLSAGLPISFGSAALAAATRTNLGLGLPALTNTDNASFRTAIGLGTASTNDASAFQPASSALTNLAANNGGSLTNLTASSVVGTVGLASNVSGIVALANGGTGATNAANARTSLGATTAGANLFTLANPSAIRFLRINADNTASALSDSDFRTAIGLGTAATSNASAFQPSSSVLTNLAANNGGSLTNITAANVVGTVGLASNITGTAPLASNVTGVVALVNGGTGATNASGARTSLGLGSAATNDSSAFQPSSSALTNLAANNGGSLTNLTAANIVGTVGLASNITGTAPLASNVTGVVALVNGGTGATNASGARTALELGTAATNPSTAFQPSSTVLTNLAANNGGSLTNLTAANIVGTVGLASNITGTAPLATNVTGIVALANGGTGATNAASARTSLGATTAGANLFTLANPSAITFLRINADNTASALSAADFRTALSLGTAATNPATAFQPSSTVLSNLANNNGGSLTNLTAANVVGTVGLASNITGTAPLATNVTGIVAIANGGTGANSAGAARTNLELGAVNAPTFSNVQLGIFGTGSATGFVGRQSSGTFSLYGTNVTTSVPAFYGWSGFANVAMNAGEARTNLGLGATWLTNTDAASFRTAIGLGTAATNPSTAFQPSSANLTNLAANNGGSLTNLTAANIVGTVGLASNITGTAPLASNVTGIVALANGGTGANSAGGARTNLGLGWSALTNTNASTSLLGVDASGQVIADTGTNALTLTKDTTIASSGGSMSISVNDGAVAVYSGAAGENILTLPVDDVPVFSPFYYWNDPSIRSSFGFSTNLNSFWTSTSAGAARTNLGLGATWLTNTNVTNFRSDIGLGSNSNVSFGTVTATDVGYQNTIIRGAGIDIQSFFPSFSNTIIQFISSNAMTVKGSLTLEGSLNFNTTTNAAITRTNLGLGATWLTNTNVTNFRSAIGLGTGDSPTFNEVFAGGGLTRTILKGSSIDIQSFFPFYSNTIISFPNSNSAVIQGNLTTSGTLTATGNVTMSGSANTAPNQTAASGSSLMTRDLTDSNPLWSLNSVRTMGAFSFGNSGTGSGASESYVRGGADVRSGTNANGYGRATIYRGINANVGFTGAGINFSQNISVAVVLGMNEMTTNSVYRLVVGGNGGVPAPADSNALTVRGFGVEFARGSSNWPSPNAKARLFAHNGTNYTNSAWTSDFVGYFARQVHAIVTSDGTGNVYLYLTNSPSDGSAPSRPPTTPTLSISGGPTNTSGGGSFVDLVTVNNSTNAPSANAVMIFYNGVLQVK